MHVTGTWKSDILSIFKPKETTYCESVRSSEWVLWQYPHKPFPVMLYPARKWSCLIFPILLLRTRYIICPAQNENMRPLLKIIKNSEPIAASIKLSTAPFWMWGLAWLPGAPIPEASLDFIFSYLSYLRPYQNFNNRPYDIRLVLYFRHVSLGVFWSLSISWCIFCVPLLLFLLLLFLPTY